VAPATSLGSSVPIIGRGPRNQPKRKGRK
jgi:hypothetical protein